jgi:hypothetical protein
LHNLKWHILIAFNENSRNKSKEINSSAISARFFQTGFQNAKNVYATSNNPLSPRITETLKRFMSNGNLSAFISPQNTTQMKKNTKMVKKFIEESKSKMIFFLWNNFYLLN